MPIDLIGRATKAEAAQRKYAKKNQELTELLDKSKRREWNLTQIIAQLRGELTRARAQ